MESTVATQENSIDIRLESTTTIFMDCQEFLISLRLQVLQKPLTKAVHGTTTFFTTIYPIALGDWNERRLHQKRTSYLSHQQDYPAMQLKMEETIQTINKMLISTNVKTGMATPLIHKHLIHNRRNSTFNYNLLSDGCHPSATFKTKIANTLSQAISEWVSWLSG